MKPSLDISDRGVLIVGAGPTGLTLANALTFHKIPFSIIERKGELSRDSKGLTISLGTRYSLETIGLKDKIGSYGYLIDRANIFWNGKRFSSINFRNLNLRINQLVTQPQPDTERELAKSLYDAGNSIEWNTKLVGVTQFEDHVVAVMEKDGKESIERVFDYVVGCEGKSSVVRDAMGCTLTGFDYSKYLVLGDYPVDTYVKDREIQYYVFEDTFFILIPIGQGLLRVVVKYEGQSPKTEVHSDEITTIVNKYIGQSLLTSKPIWLSRAQLYMRIADKLTNQRLFIAGDAAHLVSPLGGTGFNMGIQDSINLAWKLAYLYRNYASSSIMDSYNRERLDIINETVRIADRTTRMVCGELVNDKSLEAMRPIVSNRINFRKMLPTNYSGLGARYSTCYGNYRKYKLERAAGIGEILFDKTTIMDEVKKNGKKEFQVMPVMLILRISDAPDKETIYNLTNAIRMANSYAALSVAFVVQNINDIAELIRQVDPTEHSVLISISKLDARAFPNNVLYLVAPDGYVVFSGTNTDILTAENFLNTVYGLISGPPSNQHGNRKYPANSKPVLDAVFMS